LNRWKLCRQNKHCGDNARQDVKRKENKPSDPKAQPAKPAEEAKAQPAKPAEEAKAKN